MTTATEYSTGWLAEHVGGELHGPTSVAIRGINTLDEASPDEITLISNAGYARRWVESRAGRPVQRGPAGCLRRSRSLCSNADRTSRLPIAVFHITSAM